MSTLTAPLRESENYNKIVEALQLDPVSVLTEGCAEAQKLHLIHALTKEESLASGARFRLIVTYSDQRAKDILEDFRFYDRGATLFPAKDLIFYQADLRGRELDTERIRCLRRIIEGRPVTVVTTFSALMTPQIPLDVLKKSVISIEKRGELSLPETAKRLVAMGYEKQYQVEKPGQFAIRGDILDIYELTEENPYRIELWGDEVESIRSFDVLSQRSLVQLEFVRIYPATEMILSDARLYDGFERIRKEAQQIEKTYRDRSRTEEAHRLKTTVAQMEEDAKEWHRFGPLEGYIHYFYPRTENFLNLFPQKSTMIFVDEPYRVIQHASAVETEFRENMMSRAEKGYVLPGQMALLSDKEEITQQMLGFRCVGLAGLANGCAFMNPSLTVSISAKAMSPFNKSFDALEKELASYRKKGYRTILISPSRTRARRLAQDLTNDGITAFYSENPLRKLKPGEIMTYHGRIRSGFEYPSIRFAVIAESDIFGAEKKKKAKKKKYNGEQIQAFSELKPGDYIVHEDHGIGIYRGVEKIEVNHIAKDYIKIEYGGCAAYRTLCFAKICFRRLCETQAEQARNAGMERNQGQGQKSGGGGRRRPGEALCGAAREEGLPLRPRHSLAERV